jgi:hypothetical protein
MVQIEAADEFVAGLIPIVQAIRSTGASSLDAGRAMACVVGVKSTRPCEELVSATKSFIGGILRRGPCDKC